ncbi:hypothetical protein WDU94_005433 [Cyamophila willieti]
MLEIVFLQTNLEIDIFTPNKESKGKTYDKKYDTVVVNTANKSKTYSEMLKIVRENIDPEAIGVDIKDTIKRSDESLLIVAEKTQMGALKKALKETPNMGDIQIIEKKCDVLITGLDAVATKEEIVKAISDSLTSDEVDNTQIKSMYANRSGGQVATLTTSKEIAEKLISNGRIKVGWSRCGVKEKVHIPRCTNCLRVGHVDRNCKSKKSKGKRCLKCTKEGHEVKDCTDQSYCIACAKGGHRSDSMSCPKYRKLVHEKEKSLLL